MKTQVPFSRRRGVLAAAAVGVAFFLPPPWLCGGDLDPALLGAWPGFPAGPAEAVAVAGAHAYVATGPAGLRIVDVSNTERPRQVGNCDTDGYAQSVVVREPYAFVADGPAGLQVLDVSHPEDPHRVGGCDTSGEAKQVVLEGLYAYIADGEAGLQVIDISDPAAPFRVGGCDTSGSAEAVTVVGPHAFLADGSGGVVVIDVSDPSQPQRVGGLTTEGGARGIAAAGAQTVYVANDTTGLEIIDVSDPTDPRRVRVVSTETGGVLAVAVTGDRALVSRQIISFIPIFVLDRFDVSDPLNPVLLPGAYYSLLYGLQDLASAGDLAYVAAERDGLHVVSVPESGDWKTKAIVTTCPEVESVAVFGAHAYLLSRNNLTVLNVADPARPEEVFTLRDWRGTAMTIHDGYMYCCHFVSYDYDGGSLGVYDLQDPVHPRRVGGVETPQPGRTVTVSDSIAYVASRVGLESFTISDPALPRSTGSRVLSECTGLAVSGRYAFVLADQGVALVVVDIWNPFQMQEVAWVDLEWPPGARVVALDGPHVLAAGFGVRVVDVTNPLQPILSGVMWMGTGDIYGLVVFGHEAYAATVGGEESLQMVGLHVGGNLQPIGGSSAFPEGRQIALSQGRIFLATGSDGLAIYQMPPFFTSVTREGALLRLSWNGPWPTVLQRATRLEDPDWQDVEGSEETNTLAIPQGAGNAFFRLARP